MSAVQLHTLCMTGADVLHTRQSPDTLRLVCITSHPLYCGFCSCAVAFSAFVLWGQVHVLAADIL